MEGDGGPSVTLGNCGFNNLVEHLFGPFGTMTIYLSCRQQTNDTNTATMKTSTTTEVKMFGSFELVCSSDSYFCEGHGWVPVPKFWIGDFVVLHSFDIRDSAGRLKTKRA